MGAPSQAKFHDGDVISECESDILRKDHTFPCSLFRSNTMDTLRSCRILRGVPKPWMKAYSLRPTDLDGRFRPSFGGWVIADMQSSVSGRTMLAGSLSNSCVRRVTDNGYRNIALEVHRYKNHLTLESTQMFRRYSWCYVACPLLRQ